MLEVLHNVEQMLPTLLQRREHWKSVFVNYHPPFVERLWCECGDYRVYLHRIYACTRDEALFHPHPWPSAMRVLSGTYEMGVGFGIGTTPPPIAARLLMGPGAAYEMTEPDGWHYVRPLDDATVSLMVTGKPWDRDAPKSSQPLPRLSTQQEEDLFEHFKKAYT